VLLLVSTPTEKEQELGLTKRGRFGAEQEELSLRRNILFS
jgi:hypothetical protein